MLRRSLRDISFGQHCIFNGQISQSSLLALYAIVREVDPATATYATAREGLRVGHLHLRVGNVARAEKFYGGELGLDVTRRRNGAAFLSSGGYHHHVAVNTWHSNGARASDGRRAGLAWFSMEINEQTAIDDLRQLLGAAGATIDAIPGGFAAMDPWGTRVRFTLAP